MATSGSVGWDAPLPSATSNASDIASAFDASSFIDKTRDVKVDANDYSRFDAIRDSDDDAAKSTNTAAAPVAPVVNDTCRNCHAPGAKLKCSVCKKAVYCARPCQASDWTFHKRICKKPEAPKAAAPKRSPPKASTTTTTSSSSSSATAASRSASTTAKRGSTKEIVADEPDLPADVRGYKNGLPYFHRELSHHEKQLIGDIAPQKIEPAAVAAAATAPATSATNAGSAWNHAGTFEERVMTKIAQEKLSTLFTDVRVTRGRFAAVFESPTDFSGDASICVVRGRKRYLYDFNFTLPFRVTIDGSDTSTFNGSFALREISNDEDYEIMGSLKKKPKIAVDATELLAFINARSTGGSDGSSLRDDVLRILSDFVVEYQQL